MLKIYNIVQIVIIGIIINCQSNANDYDFFDYPIRDGLKVQTKNRVMMTTNKNKRKKTPIGKTQNK